MTTQAFFQREFASALDEVGGTLQDALAALRERDWIDAGQEFYARLCLEEALVNAVTHGNDSDPSRSVRIEMAEDGDVCVIRVFDEGEGFSPADVRPPDTEQMDGRGICLIRYCMEQVEYDASEHCLIMKMRRNALCQGGSRNG
ncbi:MAG: ATP-binding protein [Candidatus Hydrogenedentes bacterium]|nr:ATP-binding protein [Candidatus Hydrogenedentota bacterium]